MKCDICKLHEAVGFLQYYSEETGTTLDDIMGPNVCEACAETMCDDDDTTTLDELQS